MHYELHDSSGTPLLLPHGGTRDGRVATIAAGTRHPRGNCAAMVRYDSKNSNSLHCLVILNASSRSRDAYMDESTVYCHWEQKRFPESKFYVDGEGRTVHGDATPLHTKEGVPVGDGAASGGRGSTYGGRAPGWRKSGSPCAPLKD